MAELEQVFTATQGELSRWLESNYAQTESVWLVKWKKEVGQSYFSYDDMVDELMRYGWVDSLPRNLDDEKTMFRISPRNPKSNWSRLNKKRISSLIKAGKMKASGLKLVEEAKKNGAWTFLDDVEKLIIPPDLEKGFSKNTKAKYYYERFPNSSKRNILEWIKNAKQASTRLKRIEEVIEKAEKNLKANHPKGRDVGPKDEK